MFRYLLTIPVLVFVVPSIQHFIEPLSTCLLADLCNHTFVPECGRNTHDNTKRMFLDECDILEYMCDTNLKYVITNYTDCFNYVPVCPTVKQPAYMRMGDYKVLNDRERRIVYAPTIKTTLAMPLGHGKRRYTPKSGRRLKSTKETCITCKSFIQKPSQRATTKKKIITHKSVTEKSSQRATTNKKVITYKSITPKPSRRALQITTRFTTQPKVKTVILQRITVIKNGKMMIKVVKGTALQTQSVTIDSDFLE